ncbi:Lsr2 dimerization domain-containing protein [Spelaeicoccus albus]|uniref:Lsr2 protein n=1 Tax=Spelaeicoccus albus TaxID=1280376 RepID=A0A7Z0AAI9_9MICO|nr:histone-like nucleoid-structuring protein Lsr2 [Spelaeicoccus albus]NYI66103.1 hypothetical protein [Spelaeicoccus albus]
MTTRSIVESDLSGAADAMETRLGYADTWYVVDLTKQEQQKLEAVLEPYLGSGRRALAKDTARKREVPETTSQERDEIRAWAVEQGFALADRGRIPKKIMAAYDRAHEVNRAA